MAPALEKKKAPIHSLTLSGKPPTTSQSDFLSREPAGMTHPEPHAPNHLCDRLTKVVDKGALRLMVT